MTVDLGGYNAKCYDCLTEDVAVKIVDLAGCDHYMCQPCWDENEKLRAKFQAMFAAP